MNKIPIKINNLKLSNPILTAAGTVGHGDELKVIDFPTVFKDVGAFVTKGITLKAREGNSPIRLAETNYGLLNAIGLQNKGVDYFFENELTKLSKYQLPIIINISADTIDEFEELAIRMKNKDTSLFQGVEINVSCPNIEKGGMIFGTDPIAVEEIVRRVRHQLYDHLIITKLSPNVTDIVEIARAAIKGGTHSLSMINTVKGMIIDINLKKPLLSNKTGGLSGPAIKPIGVRMVYECYNNINQCRTGKIPIIGIGGITTADDALEYIIAGALAVGIGTGFYYSFNVFSNVKRGIINYLKRESLEYHELVGKAHK